MVLKLVLVSPSGTVYQDGHAKIELLDETVVLIQRLYARGVQVAIWSRHQTTVNNTESLEDYLIRRTGVPVRQFTAASGNLPARQYKGSVDPILAELGMQRHETILVGNGDTDLQAGVNNKLLLVRPEWYNTSLDYGFPVKAIGGLARFCELFALRQHPIYWAIDKKDLQVRAMGPFSTFRPDFATFGADAKAAAKQDGGERRFWLQAVISSLYFSGLVHQADYLCTFPGHSTTSNSAMRRGMDAILTTLGACFRTTYLPDVIVRHKNAVKSQLASKEQKTFRNQLDTLHLNRFPLKNDGQPRKSALKFSGKTFLVIDDFVTNGRSLDVARAYIEAAGGKAILFGWLKTINTSYLHMNPDPILTPFAPNTVTIEPNHIEFGYHAHIIDPNAPGELDARFAAFKAWEWP
jgi:hypothetical protein